jgi:beta-fructofuranosidase
MTRTRLRGLSLAALGAVSACGAPGGGATPVDGAPPWADAVVADDRPIINQDYVPYLVGELSRVYQPSGDRYLNDHALARGPDGVWHLYGINAATRGTPQLERTFLHATATSLIGPWTELPDVLDAADEPTKEVLWAPFVLDRGGGRWSMYYWGGVSGSTDAPARGTRRADTGDLRAFTRVPGRVPGGRDPFVLRVDDRWLLYSVGADAQARGQIVVSETRTPDDVTSWSTPVAILTDPVPSYPWGNVESPYVVPYAGRYYLFVTRTGPPSPEHVSAYDRTLVFRSADPARYEWRAITEMRAHAAEVLEADGAYYLTSGGWSAEVGPKARGLSIAPMRWAPQ